MASYDLILARLNSGAQKFAADNTPPEFDKNTEKMKRKSKDCDDDDDDDDDEKGKSPMKEAAAALARAAQAIASAPTSKTAGANAVELLFDNAVLGSRAEEIAREKRAQIYGAGIMQGFLMEGDRILAATNQIKEAEAREQAAAGDDAYAQASLALANQAAKSAAATVQVLDAIVKEASVWQQQQQQQQGEVLVVDGQKVATADIVDLCHASFETGYRDALELVQSLQG